MASQQPQKSTSTQRVKLHAVADFTTGVNISRMSSATAKTSPVIAANDLLFLHNTGELRYAAPEQIGKVLTSNTAKVHCGSALDPDFLLYLFTHSPAIKRQLTHGAKEGSVVTRVSLAAIKNLEIPLVPFAEQKQIGAAARKLSHLQQQQLLAADLAAKLFNSVLSSKDWNK